MELKICQSCGMPMQEEQYGTEKDGSKNDTYCCYCYKNGEMEECTMEDMVNFCAPIEVEQGRAKTLEEAKEMLMAYFPTLSRWKKRPETGGSIDDRDTGKPYAGAATE